MTQNKAVQTEQQKLEAIERLIESALEIADTIRERLDQKTLLSSLSETQQYLDTILSGEES